MRRPLRLGPWTLGAPDVVRLREREAMFVWVRWAAVAVPLAAFVAEEGRYSWWVWLTPPFIVAVNLAATFIPPRLRTPAALRALGVVVTAADGAVVASAMFNYAANADTATGLVLMLVVFEAAVRFGVVGGIGAGALAGVATHAWTAFRESEYGFDYLVSTVAARTMTYVLAGALLGMLIDQLERTGRHVRAQLRRGDAIGQFAIDAPRLGVDEAAKRLAEILHRDLGYELAAFVVVDESDDTDERRSFRLVAIAGYDPTVLERYGRFPVTAGIVGRCVRTGEPQLLPDVSTDPDYMEVDSRTRSEMTVPLRARGEVFGAIDVSSSELGAFDEHDLNLLEAAAAPLALAFDNAQIADIERRTISELEQLAALKDDFIAIANHELRTPVTTISGFAHSLLRQRHLLTEEELADAIERLARQSAHLKALIEDLLTVPGARAGRPLERVPVRLAEVVAEVARELDPHDALHDLRIEVDPELPSVEADRSAVRRVLTNLVGNAVKYSPKGGEVILRAERDGDRVRIDVVDHGVGIDDTHLPTLFTKFGKAPSPDSGGMGLGLFIVKELVEQMGGQVGVESRVGEGSRFWFSLPVVRQHIRT